MRMRTKRRRRWLRWMIPTAGTFLALLHLAQYSAAGHPVSALGQAPDLSVGSETRAIVFAPHPDDETLAAAGLIQAIHRAGGQVRVVFLTNGDGFPVAAQRAFEKVRVNKGDFLRLGQLREGEAREALAQLGVPSEDTSFLGFPDQGLVPLWTRNWDQPFRSPVTGADAVPYQTSLEPGAPYTGAQLAAQVDAVMAAFQPNLIVAPGLHDLHPDHQATGLFVRLALEHARARGDWWAPEARYFEYAIHHEEWRETQARNTLAALRVPDQVADRAGPWARVSLTAEQMNAKRQAVRAYRSQTAIMARFMHAFVRQAEAFREGDTDIAITPGRGIPLVVERGA